MMMIIEDDDWWMQRDDDLLLLLQQIDGEAFLLLTQNDIVNILKIKLGPALKIYKSIPKWAHDCPLTNARAQPKICEEIALRWIWRSLEE